MKKPTVISIQQFCTHYDIPPSFIESLSDFEIIEIIVDDQKYIDINQITIIEKMIRLHYDLHVNFEGLDVILNLLSRIENLQDEINSLHNKLDFHNHNLLT
jgi:hypothetical protein